jgi:hypothetical protein
MVRGWQRLCLTSGEGFLNTLRRLNGPESGGGLAPLGFFVSSSPRNRTINFSGEKERKNHMNPLIQLKPTTAVFLVALGLACFGVLPEMQALLPAEIPGNPDGCYPTFNTAEGCNALFNVTGGIGDTGLGWYSLFIVGEGSFNTAVGAGALALTTTEADSNTAVGTAAMLLNTSGFENVAVGADALLFNDSGAHNNAVGLFALYSNIDGSQNDAHGTLALFFQYFRVWKRCHW